MTLDSAQLAALAAVVQHGSFERAARTLHVTPSAISQRIARLEDRLGLVLVTRGAPCRATPAGDRLARHAEAVALAEHDTLAALGVADSEDALPVVRVAVNADSLATWFVDALAGLESMRVDVVVDNEEHSIGWLRRGEVMAAVAVDGETVGGCDRRSLGRLRYRATASPQFVARYFPDGVTPQALAAAPALSFNAADRLQARWAGRYVGPVEPGSGHCLPSANAFVDAAEAGIGWGLNPAPLIAQALAERRLVELLPDTPFDVPLAWHYVRRLDAVLGPLTEAVATAAGRHLVAPD
ncbi:ArgP/LysG family DNA-binding transcriptional regulator [Salinisphaera sp.]|uniref:ArgP/LysG family DNA-binding transcriptional regulator n=1 Tax=Salinisphaera sp. TaxID=1914330 RepID=UPI002D7998BC|nr:ArgP/LysG family DNA-binding transcriptional regulator [Salinisphaera sp.]HET7314309.1 ArgP/LysG family DNA-binding transcriptional regulator [Salinisphaera sp.]